MFRLSLIPLLAVLAASPVLAIDFHVAPGGNDVWSGHLAQPNADKTDGPLASLAGARDAVRRWKAEGGAEAVRVFFADGVYRLKAPVVFEPQDGGSKEAPISYEAEPGAHPVISGGRRITGFQRGADGVWTTQIPQVAKGAWYFEELLVDGKLATRARTPNEGWFQAAGPATAPIDGVPLAGPLEKTVLLARTEDLAGLAGLSKAELHDVNTIVYHSWNTSRHRIAGLDATIGAVQFTGPARWGFFQQEPFHRIIFENYRGALDAPGEWFLDRNGTLSYIARPGEDMTRAEVVAPVTPRWLALAGDDAHGQFVEYLQFRGLHFDCSQFLLPPAGWSDPQADAELGAAIEADGARNILFENCEISSPGTYAMWFRRGCSDSRVVHCHLHDLQAGGIRIGETSAVRSGDALTRHIGVEDCIIQAGGRYFQGAVGVFIGHSSDNEIVHNDIGDFYYTAISVGWVWGFGPSVAARNHIEWNHLHHLGWGVLSDMGAVYTLGVSPGTVVSHNRVHDISCYSYGGWGLYPDEGSTQITFEDNLVYRTQSGGFHQHYGKENVVRNNIFAFGQEMQLRHSRNEDHLAFTFEKNIVVWNEGKLFGHLDPTWLGGQVKLDHNLYWRYGVPQNGGLTDIRFAGMSWASWQGRGQDAGSIIADPLFVAPESGDFHLKPESPAFQIGFEPFDYEKAGVTGDDTWKQLAAARQYPPMRFEVPHPEPVALTLHDGFEYVEPGGAPRIAHIDNGGRPNAIRVVADDPSAGMHCLLIEDGPDAKPSWNPHLYYRPNHRHGISRVSFDVKVESEAVVVHEWRDGATPYRTGPAFKISQGRLSADDRDLMAIPPGTWVHFEIEAGMGEKSTGLWTLVVTVKGSAPQRFDGLKFVSPVMKSLDWLGFSSPGTAPAKWWLDEMDIGHRD